MPESKVLPVSSISSFSLSFFFFSVFSFFMFYSEFTVICLQSLGILIHSTNTYAFVASDKAVSESRNSCSRGVCCLIIRDLAGEIPYL